MAIVTLGSAVAVVREKTQGITTWVANMGLQLGQGVEVKVVQVVGVQAGRGPSAHTYKVNCAEYGSANLTIADTKGLFEEGDMLVVGSKMEKGRVRVHCELKK